MDCAYIEHEQAVVKLIAFQEENTVTVMHAMPS